MSAPYHYLHRRLENVLKSYLQQQMDASVTMYTFLEVAGLGEAEIVLAYILEVPFTLSLDARDIHPSEH
jgi:hypothetical protein